MTEEGDESPLESLNDGVSGLFESLVKLFKGFDELISQRTWLEKWTGAAIVAFVMNSAVEKIPALGNIWNYIPTLGTNQLLGILVGVVIVQTVYQGRKLNRLEGEELVMTDGGPRVDPNGSDNSSEKTGAGAIGGAIAGAAIGSSYGPGGTVAGAIVGLAVGDSFEDYINKSPSDERTVQERSRYVNEQVNREIDEFEDQHHYR